MLSLSRYLLAGTPIIYLKTRDYGYAMKYIRYEISQATYKLSDGSQMVKQLQVWTCANGLTDGVDGTIVQQPIAPIQPLMAMEKYLKSNTCSTVFVLFDYHKFITQPHIWRALLLLVEKMAASNSSLVIVAGDVVVPPEIENYVTVLDYPLPNRDDLLKLTTSTFSENNIDMSQLDLNAIVNFGLGLTRTSYLNSLYLLISSVPVTTQNACRFIKMQKENLLAQSDLLRPLESEQGFEAIVGLDVMKNFTKRMIGGGLGRGILILGVPGGGKTAFCSCLGKETGRPVLQMDFSRLMGGIVGETESKTAQALEMVDAMQPAILFIDEIEKGLAGTTGASGDSGTSKRQGGQFLKWLSDHKSDVYVVATANDISALPSEFLRAERWDTIFFVDLPDIQQAQAIFSMYKAKYQLEADTSCGIQDIANWTGAEIKSLCRIARGTGVSLREAATMIVPMCKVAKAKLDALRQTASSYAVLANITQNTPSAQGFTGGVKRGC